MDARARSVDALAARALEVRVAERLLVHELTLQLAAGDFLAVLGCNGSGKTLTLHTLAGLRAPTAGAVLLRGTPLGALRRRDVARHLGVLAQDREEGLSGTVMEAVLIGRHPHLAPLQWEGEPDREVARRCLERVDLGALAARSTDTLSGGEQRRVAIAALLAQDPDVFLLDEPTNHLDPHHQLGVLTLFRELTRAGRTVLATLHDASLAARYADRALLLFGDGRWLEGRAESVLSAATLSELYQTEMRELTVEGHRLFVPR